MSKNNAYPVPMTPVTPAWAAHQQQGAGPSSQPPRQRLLPSAIEISTPPNSIPRKFAGNNIHQNEVSTNYMQSVHTPLPPLGSIHGRVTKQAHPKPKFQFPISPHTTNQQPSLPPPHQQQQQLTHTKPSPEHLNQGKPGNIYEAYNNYILRQATEDKTKVVWSPEVEAAFMEALWLIPCDSRKIVVDQRGRGRNELIADYLKMKLNAHRTRKQVSSHLQVLKKLLAGDHQFLDIVGPKRTNEDAKREHHARARHQGDGDLTIFQLMESLRLAKADQPKPKFLLQAEENFKESLQRPKQPPPPPARRPTQHQLGMPQLTNPQMAPAAMMRQPAMQMQPPQFYTMPPQQQQQQQPVQQSMRTNFEPPMAHPIPMHPMEHTPELIVPSASVPPNDLLVSCSPRRGHTRHHRTTSRSVDLNGDGLVPVQFIMTRRYNDTSPQFLTYTRLIYSAYSSPMHEVSLDSLVPKFPELKKLVLDNKLHNVKIVQGVASLYVKPANGAYSSDVQFAVATDQPNPLQHRYVVRTVITSRGKDLLRCEMPCMFHSMIGRPFEQDKEVINVPFLSDFWSDFLARLNDSSSEYTEAALCALNMFQAIYRVDGQGESLCFIALYQFNSAPDEFSARTRFRKVRNVSNSQSRLSNETRFTESTPAPPAFRGNDSTQSDEHDEDETKEEPTTPTRNGNGGNGSNVNNQQLALGEHTPRPLSTPSILGLGTPGLSALLNCESPAIFASPHRVNQFHNEPLDINQFNNVNNEMRGSPRNSKFEIQRSMTAFEPAGWDEMQDWIYK